MHISLRFSIIANQLCKWMPNHATLCFSHKSVVQAWNIIILAETFFSGWFASVQGKTCYQRKIIILMYLIVSAISYVIVCVYNLCIFFKFRLI